MQNFCWQKGTNPSSIIKEINKHRKLADGKISYNGFAFEVYFGVLASCICDIAEISDSLKYVLLRKALFNTEMGTEIELDHLIKLLNIEKHNYQKIPSKPFTLYTSISASWLAPRKYITFDDCYIYFVQHNKKFYGEGKRDLERIRRTLELASVSEPKMKFLEVYIKVSARNSQEAYDIGMRNLEYFRGLMNIFYNLKHRRVIEFNKVWRPTNKIVVGPYHTVHNAEGVCEGERFWYEPSFVEPSMIVDFDKDWSDLYRFVMNIKKKLKKSKIGPFVRDAIRRYCLALDQSDQHSSFRDLWATLEFLTVTQNANFDSTIRRIVNLYGADNQIVIEICKYLKLKRNQMVHAQREVHDSLDLVEHARDFVESLILFLVNTKAKFETEQEIGYFLDLPRDVGLLERREHLLRYARDFRQG